MKPRLTRWVHRDLPRCFAPRYAKALHEAARVPPRDNRDNPQYRAPRQTSWPTFTPPCWSNFAPPLTARHSRLCSSRMFNVLKTFPSSVLWWTKSYDQTWSRYSGRIYVKRERIVFLGKLDNFLPGNIKTTKVEGIAGLIIFCKFEAH